VTKKSQSATRDDVAKLAGVAPSTVSNVINNKGNVSEKLRQRIKWAIEVLDYKPNQIARSLVTKSSRHIGLIIDEITNPHFAELAKGAHYEASRLGYVLSISLGSGDVDGVIEDFISRQFDGIIYNAYMREVSPRIGEAIEKSSIPYVDCNGITHHGSILLEIDYYSGMKDAYYYLTSLGHEKIAYISGIPLKDAEDGGRPDRAEAFIWCCRNFDRDNYEDYIILPEPPYYTNYEKGYYYGQQLLSRNLDMTAVIVVNDYMAIGVLRALREKGVRVPEDVSVISFDNTIYAQVSCPALTSVGSPVFDMGRKAVEYIMQQKEMPVKDRKKIVQRFPMELVVRESTAPLR